jgi:signal transduction histidine kinase
VISGTAVLTGLSSAILALADAGSGRLFVGSYTGLQVFDPERGTMQPLSTFEGIPRGRVDALVADLHGGLLATSGRRLVRMTLPLPASPNSPLRCLLSTVRVGGRTVPAPEAGLERVDAPDIQPAQNVIEIEFVGLSSRLSEPLTYEYRLQGVSDEWLRASDRRITYAGLAAGRYRFEARASGPNGVSVSPPAVVTFRVLPPWYQRSWFVMSVIAALLLVAYAAHRVELAHVVRTERLRSRIATDLHDDIGASLSQIAILAEVARRRAGEVEGAIGGPLSSIATTSRDLVDAMSDIVWAINPRTDSLTDLSRRMHRFAEETLGGADIALKFSAPPPDTDLKIGADLRRELYLILKESVNNIARHSGASEAVVDLSLARHELRLEIADNGRGFDPGLQVDGNGVASMRKRAAAFGGTFAIHSAPGRGTRVSLTVHLRGHSL